MCIRDSDHPVEIEENMVFALETYCAAKDGISAARIEEEVRVTSTGNELLTKFPADELLVAGTAYVRGADLLPTSSAPATDGGTAKPAKSAARGTLTAG